MQLLQELLKLHGGIGWTLDFLAADKQVLKGLCQGLITQRMN